jgi:hypothetical protein
MSSRWTYCYSALVSLCPLCAQRSGGIFVNGLQVITNLKCSDATRFGTFNWLLFCTILNCQTEISWECSSLSFGRLLASLQLSFSVLIRQFYLNYLSLNGSSCISYKFVWE